MVYKGYVISKSLYGDEVMYIARSPARVVVLRENTLVKLEKAIDKRLADQEKAKESEETQTEVKKGLFVRKPKKEEDEESPTSSTTSSESGGKSTKKTGGKKKLIKSPGVKGKLIDNKLKGQVQAAKGKPGDSDGKENFWDRLK